MAQPLPPSPMARLHGLLRGRYPFAITLGLVLGVAGAAAAFFGTPIEYESVGSLRIRPALERVVYESDGTQIMPNFNSYMDLQVTLIGGSRVLREAAKAEGIAQLFPQAGDDPDAVAMALAGGLHVDHPRRSELLNVRYTHAEAKVPAAAVNAITEAYVRVYHDERETEQQETLQRLDERAVELNDALAEAEAKLAHAITKAGSGDLNYAQHSTSIRIDELDEQIEAIDRLIANTRPGDAEPDSEVSRDQLALQDGQLSQMLWRLDELKQAQVDAESRFGVRHPTYLKAEQAVVQLERSIEKRIAAWNQINRATTATALMGGDLETLQRQREAMLNTRADQQAKLTELTEALRVVESTRGRVKILKEQLAQVEVRKDQLITERPDTERIEILEVADEPFSPKVDKRRSMAAVAGVGGMGLGVGVVALLGLVRPRLLSSSTAAAGVPVLGSVPLVNKQANADELAALDRALHRVRTKLDLGASQIEGGRVIVVVSPLPGDGKTSIASGLAGRFAATGRRTLLVDGDIECGTLSRRLHMNRQPLGQILKGNNRLDDLDMHAAVRDAGRAGKRIGEHLIDTGLVSHSDVDRALRIQSTPGGLEAVLDGGPLAAHVRRSRQRELELLPRTDIEADGTSRGALPRFTPSAAARILAEARAQFDVTIIDTGPLLGAPDALLLAAQADQTVLVVMHGGQVTPAKLAIEELSDIGAPLAGIVYNRVASASANASYAVSVSRRDGVGESNGVRRGLGINESLEPADTH
ncbi:MAG: hypothetical protein AAGD32_06005 [Planctomycetota bacterium]